MSSIFSNLQFKVALAVALGLIAPQAVRAGGFGGQFAGMRSGGHANFAPQLMSKPAMNFKSQQFNQFKANKLGQSPAVLGQAKLNQFSKFKSNASAKQLLSPVNRSSMLSKTGALSTASLPGVLHAGNGVTPADPSQISLTQKLKTNPDLWSKVVSGGVPAGTAGTGAKSSIIDKIKTNPDLISKVVSPGTPVGGSGPSPKSSIIDKIKANPDLLTKVIGAGGAGGTGGAGGATGGSGGSAPTTPTTPTTPPSAPPSGNGGGFPFPLPVVIGGIGAAVGGGFGGAYAGDYVDATPVAVAAPVATPMVAQGSGNVDLVVEDIRQVQGATVIAGPAYQVIFRNQGTVDAGPFRVGIFAMLDGRPADDARAVIDVAGLAAGQEQAVTLRLPGSSMRLVSVTTGQPSTFSQLLVAVDPDGAVAEADKANNMATVDRTALEAH